MLGPRVLYLPDESATSFMAISKLSPSTKAKDKFTQPVCEKGSCDITYVHYGV